MFSKPKANVSDAEKARIEFNLQQIAECVGFQRFTLPVLDRKRLLGLYESERNPQKLIEFVGEHLAHDVGEIRLRLVPQPASSNCGSSCGGGTCDGPNELPGNYVADERTINLEIEIDSDPQMALATLINGVVCDLLHQNNFAAAHLPERVDLAVVGTGLGMLRNNISLVKKQTSYWDSTQWELSSRPFLDVQSLAYANAIAAWSRGDGSPAWASDLPSEIKRPMRNSLKYLQKTSDSFFDANAKKPSLTQSQNQWWQLAACSSPSSQVIAIRHIEADGKLDDQQESLLLEKLRSKNHAIVLHAIAATERMELKQPSVISNSVIFELRLLADHRSDEVRAKAICVLARLGQLDDSSIETAATMIQDDLRHLVLAGVYALSTISSVPDHILPIFDRSFLRALRACNCEFIDLFLAVYNRWLDNPQSHLEHLLQDSPEHLPIALESLQKVNDELVQIQQAS